MGSCGSQSQSSQDGQVDNLSLGALPDSPDPNLARLYSVDVLTTTKGLIRGSWGQFKAEAFYRPLPKNAITTLRHLLIAALELTTYAAKEGEVVEVDTLGEGSYARVFGMSTVAAKVISDRERPWVHRAAVENALIADREAVGPRVYGHGNLERSKGGHFRGTVILMERLEYLSEDVRQKPDTATALLGAASRLARVGFHNDLKFDNVMCRRHDDLVVIDFDLLAPWTLQVAVSSGCIEHDFRELLEPLGPVATQNFREYCDLFGLSLTLQDGPVYRVVLGRLKELWSSLEAPVLRPLLERTPQNTLMEVPFEALVRVPLQGVTVNLLDLRGNVFAHAETDQSLEGLPQLVRSNGVYWP